MNEIITPTWVIAQKKYEILMLQAFLKNEKISRIVEVGTWTGGSALLWAHMVSKYEDGIVYCCDLQFKWGAYWNRDLITNIITHWDTQIYTNSAYRKYIQELQGDSHDPVFIEKVRNQVGEGSIDFMFIDGDHSYEGIKADFNNYYSLVKKGGFIAFHDIIDSEYHRSFGCYVEKFWQEIKNNFEHWEFIDGNSYVAHHDHIVPSLSMGIGVVRVK